jgi:signal transduction histidine kinase/ActR/RegA family two-component response regulator
MNQDSIRHRRRRTIAAYCAASGLIGLALWVELLIAGVAGAEFRFLAFSVAVAASAWHGGLGPGIAAILLACLASDYYFLGPGAWLRVDAPYQAYVLAGFAAGWLAVCFGVHGVHRRMRRDREARVDAGRAAAHADRLAQLEGALGRARTSSSVIEAAVQEPLHALRADGGMLLVVADDRRTVSLVRAVAHEPAVSRPAGDTSLAIRSPLGDAVQRQAPVVLESGDAWRTQYPEVPDHVRLAHYEATAVVPLLIGSRVTALVRLDFTPARTFTSHEEEYLSVLGSSAGQALDRAWHLETAQRARADAEALRARADQELVVRQRTEQALRASETRHRSLSIRTARMHELTAALSEAVTVSAVAEAVVRHGSVLVGAPAASVSLLVGHGTRFEQLHAVGQRPAGDDPRGIAAEAGLCATDAVRTGRPVFVHSWGESQERYWRSASLAADAAFLSTAALPLLVEGVPLGVVEFHFSVPVNFDAEYQALLMSVAQHCAQALDRARLYESAQSARREAETANRLKDDFLSIVSHELRTPLNAVLGWSSMLRDRSLGPEITERAVHSIYDNAMRQAKLIDDLLDVSRMATGQALLDVQELQLATLLAGVVESVMPAAALAGVAVTVGNLPAVTISGDRRRLEQVFFNLLGNALKFTPSGGRVTIDATCLNGMVDVRVSDTGVGIEPAFLPHVFERFRQGDSTPTRSHGGLGLGLTIARQLVEAHNGHITVESAGRHLGATFSVRLPAASSQADDPRPAATGPRADESRVPHLDGIHVVIVDDEPDAREVMAQALRLHGARVTTAASAAEAVEILHRTNVDVMLADIAMPDEDGYSLMRRVRAFPDARIASVPAAAVTAHARHAERERAFAAGFQDHLAKPFDPVQLVRTVDRLVGRRSEFSGSVRVD